MLDAQSRLLSRFSPRVAALIVIASNLLPFIGVAFLGWSIFTIIFIYWAETFIIGFYNLLKMAYSRSPRNEKLSEMAFFALHFFLFLFVQLLFILVFFADFGMSDFLRLGLVDSAKEVFSILDSESIAAVAALFVGNGIFFWKNHLQSGAARHTEVKDLMFAPYPRIIVQQITILLGGWIVFLLSGVPQLIAVLILLLMKVAISIVGQQKEEQVAVEAAQVE
ncbi:MAG TPA: DUF6498-containing protein [Pyrinomonadaceae bacterium]|jgi:hypothetical protein